MRIEKKRENAMVFIAYTTTKRFKKKSKSTGKKIDPDRREKKRGDSSIDMHAQNLYFVFISVFRFDFRISPKISYLILFFS